MVTSSRWTRRDFLKRSATAGGLAIGGAGLLGACSSTQTDNALSRAREAGSISVGVANEQPYGFVNKQGQVTGESPEVARAVLQGMNIGSIRAEVVEFGSLIPALNAGRYDIVCAGMFITPERCANAAFSIPDYTAQEAFLVPQGNPQQVTRYEDVAAKDLQLAVLGAAVERDYAIQSGVPAGNIQVFPSQNALLQAVVDQRVYCASLTDISLNYLVDVRNPDAPVEVTPSFRPVINGEEVISAGGFVFRPANDALETAFNRGLRELQESGRWLQIASRFGFSEANLVPEGLTTAQLCRA